MVMYECEACNFHTNLKANFTRHQNTKKHAAKMKSGKKKPYKLKNEPKMNQNEPKRFIEKSMNQNEPNWFIDEPKKNESDNQSLNCKYCNKKFKTCASKRRHEIHRCHKKDTFIEATPSNNTVESNDINSNKEFIEALREQNRLVKEMMEQKLEKFEAVLEEKERCIDLLKDQIGTTSNHNTFNLIKNDIYTMKPLEFLNTFCINNPSLEQVIGMIQNSGLHHDEQLRIKEASAMKAKHAIAKEFDSILKSRNRTLITDKPLTCDNVLFTNDGSNRRYIAKGQKEWQFYSTDDPLDSTTNVILEQINEDTEKPILMNKKERTQVNNSIKRLNDFNDIRKNMLEQLEHKNQAILPPSNADSNELKNKTEVQIENAENLQLIEYSDSESEYNYNYNYNSNLNSNSNVSEEREVIINNQVYDNKMEYLKMYDCGREWYFDPYTNNVFDMEDKKFVGIRVHDDESCECNPDQECWFYIKYLNEI